MALPAIVDTLDTIPELLREHYRPGSRDEGLEGKFILDVDPADSGYRLEDVSAIMQALRDERRAREAAEQARKEAEQLVVGGMRARDIKARLQRLEELERLDPAKEADRLAQARVEAALAKMREEHDAEREQLLQQAEKYRDSLRRATLSAAVERAIAQADVLNPEAVRLKVERHLRVREDDGGFVLEVVDDSGEPIFDSKGRPATVESFVAGLRNDEKWASAFKPVAKAGAGVVSSAGGSRTMARAAFEQLPPGERQAVIRAGIKLVDA